MKPIKIRRFLPKRVNRRVNGVEALIPILVPTLIKHSPDIADKLKGAFKGRKISDMTIIGLIMLEQQSQQAESMKSLLEALNNHNQRVERLEQNMIKEFKTLGDGVTSLKHSIVDIAAKEK